MKRILLIASHLGAGSSSLCYSLAQSKTIQWVQDGLIFDDLSATESILASNHKYSNFVGLYVNEVFYNYQISHKVIYKACDFIYLIREPKNAIKVEKPKDAAYALDYYIFRLRRLYEMSKETKNAIFLTWEDLLNEKGLSLITKRLNIANDLTFHESEPSKLPGLPLPLLREAERAYELCLYRVKSDGQVLMC
jgi:hypothetical protein